MIYRLILICQVASENCCFAPWSNWLPSPLTCDKLCPYRTREVKVATDDLVGAAWSWFTDAVGAENNCEERSVCPNEDVDTSHSCEFIECREFD